MFNQMKTKKSVVSNNCLSRVCHYLFEWCL